MSDEPKVSLTPDAIEYLDKVRQWVDQAPKAEDFWIGKITVEWGHAEKPIATFEAVDDFWVVEVTNG